jgi:signal peptidase I
VSDTGDRPEDAETPAPLGSPPTPPWWAPPSPPTATDEAAAAPGDGAPALAAELDVGEAVPADPVPRSSWPGGGETPARVPVGDDATTEVTGAETTWPRTAPATEERTPWADPTAASPVPPPVTSTWPPAAGSERGATHDGRGAQEDHAPHGQSHNPVDRLTRGLPHSLRVTIDWIVTIVGAVVIVLLVKAFVVNPYRIPSSSMESTLHCARPELGCEARYSDRVLANRFLYRIRDPRRGEIIVFETPPAAQAKCGAGGTFVKRLVGLPGETVEVRVRNNNGYVYINGKPLEEPYIQASRRSLVQPFGPLKVKPGNYFMMGDNRSQSCDSRMWGTVPRGNLIGKVFATYWPPNRVRLH